MNTQDQRKGDNLNKKSRTSGKTEQIPAAPESKVTQPLRSGKNKHQSGNQQLQTPAVKLSQQIKETHVTMEFAEDMINTVRQPLLVLDSELRVVTANRYFYSTFKVSENETIGQLLYNLGNKQWNIPELTELLINTLPKKLTVEDFEVEHSFQRLGPKIMLLNARELIQTKEKERFILLAVEDVTDQKKYERELKHLNKELRLKAEELQQILYITTHDLRSPLVNIQGFTREMAASLDELKALLEKADLNEGINASLKTIMKEEIPEAIHYITSSTIKMDNLLKGLLTLSRLGRQKLMFQKLDMNKLMEEVLENYQFEIGQNKISVSISNLPSCMGDKLQINQLFSNLIGNSIKFLHPEIPGKINIWGKKNKNEVKYIVEDNGIGIHKDFHSKVFGLFEKLDEEKQGIGLGMNIIKQITERHNGSIELDSELGRGTKITIVLPVHQIIAELTN